MTPPLRILVVDDEATIRDLMRDFLTLDGHTVALAAHGAEGLALFETQPFDLVFTDLAMPVMDGRLLAAAIRQKNPRQPIIMVTGLAAESLIGKDANPDVDRVLGKPITIDSLRDVINVIVRGSYGSVGPAQSDGSVG